LAETSTLSGFSIPVVVRPGTELRSGFAVGRNQRLCDPKIAVRSEDRSPRFRGVCRPFGLLAVNPLDDPEGSPLGLPATRCLRFPFGSGLNLPSGFPSFRFSHPSGFPSFWLRLSSGIPSFQPDLPGGLPSFWPVVGFPRRRNRKSRPSPDRPQARNLIVFRDLDSLFATRKFQQ
jgi:hypothetical protein